MERIKETVKNIINRVEEKGDEALVEFTKEFDSIELTPKEIEIDDYTRKKQAQKTDPRIADSLKKAAQNIRNYARRNFESLPEEQNIKNNGASITDRYIPVKSAGIYVPGGQYSYPSSVLMTAIFAREAGVKEVFMVTPPGKLTPAVIKAAQISKVDRIFQIGGAQAIAALALGTRSVPPVDIIAGPGNMYVQQAKKELSDRVGIDMLAGPSEVVIIAQGSREYSWIANDLMAQAEHAPDARAILVSPDDSIIKNVKKLIVDEFNDRIDFKKTKDIGEAVDISNRIAPEHLQVICSKKEEEAVLGGIYNAGAVFVGKYTPVAVGDYWAGPSHTLPTGRTARYSEGLNVRTFLKKVSFIKSTGGDFEKSGEHIERLASSEGMEYHKNSVSVRKKDMENEST
ncbi:MAG: histidinol dehydrogenase [Elusimicrobiota bacterium]